MVYPWEPCLRVSSLAQVGPYLSWWLWPVARFLLPLELALQLMEHHRAGCLWRLPGEGRGRCLHKGAVVGSRRPRCLLPSLGLFSHLPSQGPCAHEAKPGGLLRQEERMCLTDREVRGSDAVRFRGVRPGDARAKAVMACASVLGVRRPCHVCVLLWGPCARTWDARCSEAATPRRGGPPRRGGCAGQASAGLQGSALGCPT